LKPCAGIVVKASVKSAPKPASKPKVASPGAQKPAAKALKPSLEPKFKLGEGVGVVEYVRLNSGPPPAYEERYVLQVVEAANSGATDMEIMTMLGIGPDVLMLWRMCYPTFDAAFKGCEAARTERVRQALHRRACGYEQPTEKLITVGDKVKRVVTFEHIPADRAAAQLWMEVHEPDRWRKTSTVHADLRVGRIGREMSPAEAAELWRATLEGAKLIEGEVASTEDVTE
jgi:hypothetical protein